MTSYHLAPPAPAPAVPTLDEYQQRVIDHGAGPLLVLAGPGTGKTTTLVEAIVERIEGRGASPESVLALTFSRKAAEQLRDRITARLGRTMTANPCMTFHSFAYGLVRQYAPAELYEGPLRLLSAPEQDVILRELLAGTDTTSWPESLRHAMGTRGFAREVQGVLARAREKGLEGFELAALGRANDVPEFIAAGLFLEEYLLNLDAQGAIDYSDLIRRAVLEAETHRDELRARYGHVFVDEFQDTDPGQLALLRALAGDGRNLVAVGDPHQSIYAFRGAEVRGILEFPTTFPTATGAPAPVVALRTTRRFGQRLLVAAQRVAGRIGLPGTIDAGAREAFLSPQASHPGGRVQVLTFDTERAEAEHLADLLRRAHLEDGIGWDEMAILVRSGRSSIPPLRRALGALGVPIEVAGDELPLVQDPAVEPLLSALRAALNLDIDDRSDPGYLDPAQVTALLTGPLGGLAAPDVRRLARALRVREKAAAALEERKVRSSPELLRAAITHPDFVAGLADSSLSKVEALVALLHRVRAMADTGSSPELLLWELWNSTGWPDRLRRGVDAGGGSARRAHRDLDAIVALFDVAARVEAKRDHTDARTFLATLSAQQIPADTLADRGARGAAVRLLTAHRSKGLEWRLVVVAHVQAEAWPDLRRRSSLLQPDRIGEGELIPPLGARELLAEERRLFYVSATRARERLIVTAVSSDAEDGEQPSRFLEELGVPAIHVVGRPKRPLSLGGLVAELRQICADPQQNPALREAAARRLSRLASHTRSDERALVPAADPSTWWGTRSLSRAVTPLRPSETPIAISATVLEGLSECPMHWFLEREAGGAAASQQAANVGSIVHAVAQRVADGELEPEIEALMAHVDAVWSRLTFRTVWSGEREHDRIRRALERFLEWHQANTRTPIGTEIDFACEVALASGETVRLRGRADRLEIDSAGRIVVVDFKTGRSLPSGPAVQRNQQLALYQLALDRQALHARVPGATSGGGELIQLGDKDLTTEVKVMAQSIHTDESPERAALLEALDRAVSLLRAEEMPAIPGPHCERCSFVNLCPAKGAAAVTR